jgi:hypothetical protein
MAWSDVDRTPTTDDASWSRSRPQVRLLSLPPMPSFADRPEPSMPSEPKNYGNSPGSFTA